MSTVVTREACRCGNSIQTHPAMTRTSTVHPARKGSMPAGIMKFSTVPVRRFKSEKKLIMNPNTNRMTMRYRGNGGWIVTLGAVRADALVR